MAELVGAFRVPHMPGTPLAVREHPGGELDQLFGAVRHQVDAVDPDLLVVFDTDHFAMWYHQRLPVFAIGVAEETYGPGTDDWPGLTSFDGIPVALDLGRHLYVCGLDNGFDLTLTEEFSVDHSITVPLEMLNPAMRRPMVPFWVKPVEVLPKILQLLFFPCKAALVIGNAKKPTIKERIDVLEFARHCAAS